MKDLSIASAVNTASESRIFGSEGPCPIYVEEGELNKVWVISGENAGGKSLLCKALQANVARKAEDDGHPLTVIRIGMDIRTEGGMRGAIIFGDEQTESTGQVSAHTVLRSLDQSNHKNEDHWIILDEPDIGVGEGYRKVMGELFADFAKNLPEKTVGFMIVTHAREIAAPLIAAGASSIRVGDDLRPVAEWIRDGDLPKTLEDLKNLDCKGHNLFKAVEDAIRSRKSLKP